MRKPGASRVFYANTTKREFEYTGDTAPCSQFSQSARVSVSPKFSGTRLRAALIYTKNVSLYSDPIVGTGGHCWYRVGHNIR